MKPSALFVVLGSALLIGACSADTPTPMTTPPPITAQDGTVIALPANVADGATDEQRDAYADQVLASEQITPHRDEARNACTVMSSGVPPVGAVAQLVMTGTDPRTAGAIGYTATLAYCPTYRSAFDNLRALPHGGLRENPAQPTPAPVTVDPQLRQSQARTTSKTTTEKKAPTTREKTSGEEQREWGCQQGYITEGC